MPRYDALPASLPPRALAREAAAQYVGVGPTKFDSMVADGRMPRPVRIDGRTVWDVRALDRAFDILNGNQPPPVPPEVITRVIDEYADHILGNKNIRRLDVGIKKTKNLSSETTTEDEKMRSHHKYTHPFIDRHGVGRNYFRRPGFPSVTLPYDEESIEFLDAYRAALAGEAMPKPIPKKPTISEQSVDAVVGRCLTSSRFLKSPEASRRQYAWILKKFRKEYADEDFPSFQRGDYKRMIAKIDQPHTKKAFLRGIRFLVKFLIDEEAMFEEDPGNVSLAVPMH